MYPYMIHGHRSAHQSINMNKDKHWKHLSPRKQHKQRRNVRQKNPSENAALIAALSCTSVFLNAHVTCWVASSVWRVCCFLTVVHAAPKFRYDLRLAKNVWRLWNASWAMLLHRRGRFLKSRNFDCISQDSTFVNCVCVYRFELFSLITIYVCTSREHHIACSLMGNIVLETLQEFRHHTNRRFTPRSPPLIVKFLKTPNLLCLRQSQWG